MGKRYLSVTKGQSCLSRIYTRTVFTVTTEIIALTTSQITPLGGFEFNNSAW